MPRIRRLETASLAVALMAFLIFGPTPARAQAFPSPAVDLVVYCPHPVDFTVSIMT